MNKFQSTDTGGLPLRGNDFTFMQQALAGALTGMLTAYNSPLFIISGCERSVSNGTVTIASGYVCISGEVYFVHESYYPEPVTGESEYWEVYTIYDSAGSKLFENGVTHQTYRMDMARVVKGTTPPTGMIYNPATTLQALTRAFLPLDSWQLYNTLTVPPSGLFPGTYELFCYRDLDGFVHLKGEMMLEDIGAGAVDFTVATLPVGYRPASDLQFTICGIKDSSTGEIGVNQGVITTAGIVKLTSFNMGYAAVLDSAEIPPFRTS